MKHMRIPRMVLVIAGCVILGVLAYRFAPSIVSRLNTLSRRRAPAVRTGERCKDCNLLILSLDTVGASHLPCYGYERNTAPYLCALASENILFAHPYANASWTLPSDVSMFTSLYPRYHGIEDYYNYGMHLPPNTTFLPEVLQQNGYRTIFAIPENDRAFPVSDVYYRGVSDVVPVGVGPDEHLDTALDSFADSVRSGKKTFMYLHSYQAHGPYIVRGKAPIYTTDHFPNIPTTWAGIYDQFSQDFYQYLLDQLSQSVGKPNSTVDESLYEALKNAPSLETAHTIAQGHAEELDSYYTEYYYFAKIDLNDPKQIAYIKALYDQKIHELDEWIGKTLIPFLNMPGIKDHTVVLITSEHGEEFMEHGRLTHETLYDTNVKVPFIMIAPGFSHVTVPDPVQGVDVTPTFLDIAGIPATGMFFQGQSVFGAMRGENMPDRLLYAYQANSGGSAVKTIRTAKWKVFLMNQIQTFIPYELYDIQNDPGEQNNVLSDHLDVVKDLIARDEQNRNGWKGTMQEIERKNQ